ncbi:MAG: T9SS type A sorting domain-containing protein [Candidatus Cloacimonetes bacterium]|nr:T9SS type A sorting domain-containing protein [Candidatus Cloacimonadota bacterium]
MRRLLLTLLTLISALLLFSDILEEPGFNHSLVGDAYAGEQLVFVSDTLYVTNLGGTDDFTILMPAPDLPAGWIMQWCFEYEGLPSLCVIPGIPWTFSFGRDTTIKIDFTIVYDSGPEMVNFELNWSADSIDDVVMEFSFRTEDYVNSNSSELISGAILRGNYPNPFNPETRIDYNLAEAGDIEISVYDVQGRLINTLFKGYESAGEHTVNWPGIDEAGSTVSSGIYFYKLESRIGTSTRKMILLK